MRLSAALSHTALAVALLGAPAGAVAQRAQVDTVRFHAKSVEREMTYNVILPRDYADAANRDREYPTLYLLHGYGNNYQGWARFMGVPTYAPDYDLIIVMPDAGNSYYVNWMRPDGDSAEAWEDYITQDLIGHVEANYRAIREKGGRAVAGFSMGGYGALTIGLRNPELFASIGSQSGALEFGRRAARRLSAGDTALPPPDSSPERRAQLEQPNPTLDLPGFSSIADRTPQGQPFVTREDALAHDPFSLVRQVPAAQRPLIQLDCGTADSLVTVNKEFVNLLLRLDVPFDYLQLDGGHDPMYWIQAYGYAIGWHYEAMQRALGKRPVAVRRGQ